MSPEYLLVSVDPLQTISSTLQLAQHGKELLRLHLQGDVLPLLGPLQAEVKADEGRPHIITIGCCCGN